MNPKITKLTELTESQKRLIIFRMADAAARSSMFRIDDKYIDLLWPWLGEQLLEDHYYAMFNTIEELEQVFDKIVAEMKESAKWYFAQDAYIEQHIYEAKDSALYIIESEGYE